MHGELERSGEVSVPHPSQAHGPRPGAAGGEGAWPSLLTPCWLHTCPWHCTTPAPGTAHANRASPADSPLKPQGKCQSIVPLPVTITKQQASHAEVSPKAAHSACTEPALGLVPESSQESGAWLHGQPLSSPYRHRDWTQLLSAQQWHRPAEHLQHPELQTKVRECPSSGWGH